MILNHCNMTKLVQARKGNIKLKTTFIFCTVVALLSMSILVKSPYAQSQNFEDSGALGSLLEQLKSLESKGALQTLGGSKASQLNAARRTGTNNLRSQIIANNRILRSCCTQLSRKSLTLFTLRIGLRDQFFRRNQDEP